MDDNDDLVGAFNLDRRVQNLEHVVSRLVERSALSEEDLTALVKLLRTTNEPAPAQTPAVVDPTNPPKSSTEDSDDLAQRVVEPNISNDGMSDTNSETTPETESSSSRTSDTETAEDSSDATAETSQPTPSDESGLSSDLAASS